MAVSDLMMVSLPEARVLERATAMTGCQERGCTAPAVAMCAYVDGRVTGTSARSEKQATAAAMPARWPHWAARRRIPERCPQSTTGARPS
jgi:hypothetical protein